MPPPTVRGTRPEKRLVAELKSHRRQPCARCGARIDYDAPRGHPESFNSGHIKSWEDYPELRLDPSNRQPEHQACNQAAGKAEPGPPALGTTSEAW